MAREAFHIVDPKLRENHLQRLEVCGEIDVAAAERTKRASSCEIGVMPTCATAISMRTGCAAHRFPEKPVMYCAKQGCCADSAGLPHANGLTGEFFRS